MQVESTHSRHTTLFSGPGPDNITVWATGGKVTVNMQNGNDTLFVPNMQRLKGPFECNGGAAEDHYHVSCAPSDATSRSVGSPSVTITEDQEVRGVFSHVGWLTLVLVC